MSDLDSLSRDDLIRLILELQRQIENLQKQIKVSGVRISAARLRFPRGSERRIQSRRDANQGGESSPVARNRPPMLTPLPRSMFP